MPKMDKESVREKFDELKSSYHDLSKSGKVSPELRVIIDGLILLMDIVISICDAGHGVKLGGESPLRAVLKRFVSLGKGTFARVCHEGS